MEKEEKVSDKDFKVLLKLLAPFAPHMADELWEKLGHKDSIYLEAWPKYDEEKTKENTVTIGVQVNGKIRDSLEIAIDADEEAVKKEALALPGVQKWTEGKAIKKIIYVKGKIVSIVV